MMKRTEELTQKIERLYVSLETYIQKADEDDLKEELPEELDDIEEVVKRIQEYEKKLAKLFRKQKKHFVEGIGNYTEKAEEKSVSMKGLLTYLVNTLFEEDEFEEDFSKLNKDFLDATVKGMTKVTMDMIDKDVAFNTLSTRTTTWIENWSEDLADLMNLTTHEKVEKIITQGLEEGWSIQEMVLELEQLPEFDRKRARATAITEVLTANSVSQLEAYRQSPSVVKKRWLHSGYRKLNVRVHHVEMSGTEVDIDEDFDVNGWSAQHPRDTSLPASERVNCRCVLQPVVDSSILGLSKEEKEKIREQALKDFDDTKYKSPPKE